MFERSVVRLLASFLLAGSALASASEREPFQTSERRLHLGAIGWMASGNTPIGGAEVSLEMLWPEAHFALVPSVHAAGAAASAGFVGAGLHLGPNLRVGAPDPSGNGTTVDLRPLGGLNLEVPLSWLFPVPLVTAGASAGVTLWRDHREVLHLQVQGEMTLFTPWGVDRPVLVRVSVGIPLMDA